MARPDNNVIYIGIFLDPMATQRLIRAFGQAFPVRQAHHMTIWHTAEETEPSLNLPWGKTVPLKVIAHVEDDRVQAVVVEPQRGSGAFQACPT
jgi:hypothetical protein